MGAGWLELRAVGIGQPCHMAGEFNGGDLHAQANAQVGNFVFSGKAGGADFALNAALTETPGHQHRVKLGELRDVVCAEGFGVDVLDDDPDVVFHARVAQGFVEGFIAVAQIHVLADHRHVDFTFRVRRLVHQIVPAFQVGGWGVQTQLVANQAIQALFVQHAGDFVDGVDVPHGDDTPFVHVGEQRDFVALIVRDGAIGAANQGIGLDADFTQLLHGVLGGLGFQFPGGGDPRYIRQVHKRRHVRPQAQTELAHRFQERQGLDITHGAANFHNRHVHCVRLAKASPAFDVLLDFVGDVRNNLNRFAQVVATAFFFQHGLVDAAGGEVVGPAHPGGDETLVVAEVKVSFCAIIGDEDFAMLERRHRARINVDVRIELD